MLGTCGEYIVASTNTTDNIVDLIKQNEVDLGFKYLPNPFILKKIGIKSDSTCKIEINKHAFELSPNDSLEIGYNMMDISSIKSQNSGVKLIIRYLY